MHILPNHSDTTQHIFALLEGTWTGQGRACYLTIDTFEFRETLTFTRRDDTSITYEQRTEKRLEAQETYVTSHRESGFLRVLKTRDLGLVNAQSGGRVEVLIGAIETMEPIVRLSFVST